MFLIPYFLQGLLVLRVEVQKGHQLFRKVKALVEVGEQSSLEQGRVLPRLENQINILSKFPLPATHLLAEESHHQHLQFLVGTDR